MKKLVTWIVEKHMFPEYEEQLVAAIKKSGAICYLFDDTDHLKFNFNKSIKSKFTNEDCTIFYGSLQRGRELYTKTDFVPGIFLTIDNYECYKYYGMFGKHLLNSSYRMLGFNDLKRWKSHFEVNYEINKFFIRPSNGYKTFPGQIINTDKFDEEVETLSKSYGGIDTEQLIVVAPYKNIVKESRFAVINGKVIDGCVYMMNGEKTEERIIDDEALVFANIVIDKLPTDFPDPAYTLDIAYYDNTDFGGEEGYRVIEINSLCCAGLYHMDKELIVNAMNELVIQKFNDFWNIKE